MSSYTVSAKCNLRQKLTRMHVVCTVWVCPEPARHNVLCLGLSSTCQCAESGFAQYLPDTMCCVWVCPEPARYNVLCLGLSSTCQCAESGFVQNLPDTMCCVWVCPVPARHNVLCLGLSSTRQTQHNGSRRATANIPLGRGCAHNTQAFYRPYNG